MLLPFVNNQYYSEVIEGISREAVKHNYNMMLCQTDNSADKEIEILNMLKMKKLDGIIRCSKVNVCTGQRDIILVLSYGFRSHPTNSTKSSNLICL
ncbi:LacI family transcription regulator (plasmid) [Bacillus thuringiensis serovar kurstaki str. YBT-1520]|nr:LacI family transcription regulator [Bacillus thuringiensis serovar kurstaki str. YBT-1520]AIE37815.1 LacI family transcription regulator [Bacillus thuringiensis serovar kurstaki str. HD-1]